MEELNSIIIILILNSGSELRGSFKTEEFERDSTISNDLWPILDKAPIDVTTVSSTRRNSGKTRPIQGESEA